MKRILVMGTVLTAGCGGSSGPDAAQIISCPVAGADAVQFVTSTVFDSTAVSPLTNVAISATQGGDLLFVAISWQSMTSDPGDVDAVAVNAGIATEWARGGEPDCGKITEVWGIAGVPAGITNVAIHMTQASMPSVTVLEFSGDGEMLSSAKDTYESTADAAAVAATPKVHACPGQLVVSVLSTCLEQSVLTDGSLFTPIENGASADAAYFIPTAPGSYGASWTYGGGDWDAINVSFRNAGDPVP